MPKAVKKTSTRARKRGGLHEAQALVRIRAFATGLKNAGAAFSKDGSEKVRNFDESFIQWGKMLDEDCDTIERAILRLGRAVKRAKEARS